jgi:predicted translin family RNA/ssDNA-binding protein
MINKKFLDKLKQEYKASESERRQIISRSNNVLHDSKRAIFSLHREDVKTAEGLLGQNEDTLKKMEADFGYKRLLEEGSYKAGAEEFVEAKLYYLFVTGKKIDAFRGLKMSYESYLGGLCDLTGELVRLAVNKAAAGKMDEMARAKEAINDIMAQLVEFDFTGYLRTKYDQAKNNLRKIEQINYEVNLRKNK